MIRKRTPKQIRASRQNFRKLLSALRECRRKRERLASIKEFVESHGGHWLPREEYAKKLK